MLVHNAGCGDVVGNGRLTRSEVQEIQDIANKYNTEIHVVGSRSAGQGRNIDTNLPVGKGEGTRSDIDIRIDGQVDIDTRGGLSGDLSDISGGAGKTMPFTGWGENLGTYSPKIVFKPNQTPIID